MRYTTRVSKLSFPSYDYCEIFLLAPKFFSWKFKIDNIIRDDNNLLNCLREISYLYKENLFVEDEKYASLESWRMYLYLITSTEI